MIEPIVWEVVPEEEPEDGEDIVSSEELTQALVGAHTLLDAHDRGETSMRTIEVDSDGNRRAFDETGPETRARQLREGADPLLYSSSSDALYIRLKRAPITQSDEIAPGVIVDFDEAGNAIGVEVLDASERMKNKAEGALATTDTK